MRLTNQFSVMGRKYDLAYGQANTWKRKLKNDKYEIIENAVDKLGQLEDIEDELGIDLMTLFKALKNGVYYFANGTQLTKVKVLLLDNGINTSPRDRLSYSLTPIFEDQVLSFEDYGKTWALTKEELK